MRGTRLFARYERELDTRGSLNSLKALPSKAFSLNSSRLKERRARFAAIGRESAHLELSYSPIFSVGGGVL